MHQFSFDKTSEKSYSPLIKDAFWLRLKFLSFNLVWMLLMIIINFVAFFIMCLYLSFIRLTWGLFLIEICCYFIAVFDTVIIIHHYINRTIAGYHCYKRVSKIYLFGYITLLIITFITTVLPKITVVKWLHLTFTFLRNLFKQIQVLLRVMEVGPGSDKMAGVLFGILMFTGALCIQWFITCWKELCDTSASLYDINISETFWSTYITNMFFIMCGISNIGYGRVQLIHLYEQVLVILFCFTAIILIRGVLFSCLTFLKINEFSLKRMSMHQCHSIRRIMLHERKTITKDIRRKVNVFCGLYLPTLISLQEPTLLSRLPPAIRIDMAMDIYRMAFGHFPLKLKREVATVFVSEVLPAGTKIYDANKVAAKMYIIIDGIVRVMASHEHHVPIVNFSAGTCFGSSFMILPRKPDVYVYAVNFCTVHTITFTDFWDTLARVSTDEGRHLKKYYIHDDLEQKLCFAKRDIEFRARFKLPPMIIEEVIRNMPNEMPIRGLKQDLNLKGTYFLTRPLKNKPPYEDAVFLKTTCMLRFRPGSAILRYWTMCMMMVTIFITFECPYLITFHRSRTPFDLDSLFYIMLHHAIIVSYVIDVLLQSITAVDTERGFELDLKKILKHNLATWTFVVDIIAAVPIASFLKLMKDAGYLMINDVVFTILQMHCFVKSLKLRYYFRRFYPGMYHNEMVKIIGCFFYFHFLWTCFYFIVFTDIKESTWLPALPDHIGVTHKILIIYTYILTITTLTDCFVVYNIKEIAFVIALIFFGMGFYIYFLTSMTSHMIVSSEEKTFHLYELRQLRKYLAKHNVPVNSQNGITDFLKLQMDLLSAQTQRRSFEYLLDSVKNDLIIKQYSKILKREAIFCKLRSRIIAELALKCNRIFCPPNHIIVMEAQRIEHFYILEQGYCELYHANEKIPTILNPKSSFCVVELNLKRSSLYMYKTVSHSLFITISRKDIDNILRKWKSPLRNDLKLVSDELNETMAAKRVFHRSREFKSDEFLPPVKASWKTFSRIKRHDSYVDYQQSLHSIVKARICKSFLMRRTILPDGQFIAKYEVFFGIVIILMTFIYPPMLLIMEHSHLWIFLYGVFFIITLIDMYLQFHKAYFNLHGILVTHPWCTAVNYVTSHFIIELAAMFPMDLFLHFTSNIYQDEEYLDPNHMLKCLFSYNKLLYLFRLRRFIHLKQITIKAPHFFWIVCLFMLFYAIALNWLTMTYIYWNLLLKQQYKQYNVNMTANTFWYFDYQDYQTMSTQEIAHLYFNGFYWVFMITLGCGLLNDHILPWMLPEVILLCLCLLIGYILFMGFLALCIVLYNRNDATFLDNRLQTLELKTFMRKFIMSKCLKRHLARALAHLEHNWSQIHGVNFAWIAECHSALRNGLMVQIYEKFFINNPVFAMYPSELAETLGYRFKVVFFLENEVIIDLNDVTSKLYLLFDGDVNVYNAAFTVEDVLHMGSAFGNIDECHRTRSMMKYMAKSNVGLLEMDTLEFYTVIRKVSDVRHVLRHHILRENVSYIKNTLKEQAEATVQGVWYMNKPIIWIKFIEIFQVKTRWILEFVCLFSAYFTIYMFGFSQHDLKHIGIFYILDFIYLNKVIMIILDKIYGKSSQEDYLHIYVRRYLLLDLMTMFPFELIAFFTYPSLTDWSRLNRMLRIVQFYMYMKSTYKELTINILVLNAIIGIVSVTLFIHSCSCLLYYRACSEGDCRRMSWITTGNDTCYNNYLCSVFYSTTVFAQTGFYTNSPILIEDRLTFVLIALVGRLLLFIVLGQIYVMIKYFMQDRLVYNNKFVQLMKYLQQTTVTSSMMKIVCVYFNNLYTHQKGNEMPLLFEQIPSYLQCGMKAIVYGSSIFSNVIFEDCHYDFLRQLMKLTRVQTYFVDDVICRAGDINGTMYFIHKGSVMILEFNNNKFNPVETVIDELLQDDTFGVNIVITYFFLWSKPMVGCISDINMNQIQYIANNLHPDECRKLIAALHFNNFDLPNALQQAERKVPNDVPCLQQLAHWNVEKSSGQGATHDILVRRLKQINRFDLAIWLTNATYDRFDKSLGSMEESYRMYEPILLPYVNYTTKLMESQPELKVTTAESLIRVAKQDMPDPVEDIVADPTDWTIFDTISWSIVIILFLLIIVLLVYLTMASPCCNRKKRCQCSPPPSEKHSAKHKNRPSSAHSSAAAPTCIRMHTQPPSEVRNHSQRNFDSHSFKKHHCGASDCPAAYHCERCKRHAQFADTPTYQDDGGTYNHYEGNCTPCMVPPAPRPICHGTNECSCSNDGHHHNGLSRTIDIHQKIAIPMNNIENSN